MTRDEKIAFDNLKLLVLRGEFKLTGLEAIALAKALKIVDEYCARNFDTGASASVSTTSVPKDMAVKKTRKSKNDSAIGTA